MCAKIPMRICMFIRITEAHEILSDPALRSEYDAARGARRRQSGFDQRHEDYTNRGQASSWEQSESYQQAREWARQRADEYWHANLAWVLDSLFRATTTVTRAAWQGQKGVRDDMHFGSYLWLGFRCLLILASVLLCLTGVGAPLGGPFAAVLTCTVLRNGKFVGFGTLIKATLLTILFFAALLPLILGVLGLLGAL